tara:strand:- start:145 stop:312 length:168 start_codon:yes stop_codon:yes gene_type:complete
MLKQTKRKNKRVAKSNKGSKLKRLKINTKKIVLNDYSIIEGCIRQTMELPIENSG